MSFLRLQNSAQSKTTGYQKNKGEMMHNYALDLELEFEEEAQSRIIFNAITPDIQKKHKRSISKLKVKKNKIYFKIVAKDPIALRASFSSFMKHVMLAESILIRFS